MKISGFSKAVGDIVNKYGDDVRYALEDAIKDTAREAQKELRQTSPKRTGDYAAGWRSENTGNRIAPSQTIYNQKPGLPHLLEFGHAKRGGGRTKAQPHIAPVSDNIPEMIEEKLRRLLE